MAEEVFETGTAVEAVAKVTTREEPAAEAAAPQPEKAQAEQSARIKELEGELERERQRSRSREGQRAARVAQDTINNMRDELASFKREFRRYQIGQTEQNEERQKQRLSEVDQEERQDAQANQLRRYQERVADRMNGLLERHNFDHDHAIVQDALQRWQRAKSQDDVDDVYDYLDDAIAKEQSKPKPSAGNGQPAVSPAGNAAKLAMGTSPSSPGGPPKATKDNIDRLFMQWEREHPDRPNPYEADYRSLIRNGRIG